MQLNLLEAPVDFFTRKNPCSRIFILLEVLLIIFLSSWPWVGGWPRLRVTPEVTTSLLVLFCTSPSPWNGEFPGIPQGREHTQAL